MSKRFWLCTDARCQYRMHVLQGTSCGCSQLWRSRVSRTGECDFANALPAEHSVRKVTSNAWMDATAGIAIGSRRGLRRVKHRDTVLLWVQAVVTECTVTCGKKPTKEILADFLNKYVDAATMFTCLSGVGMKFQSGTSRLTLRA